MSKPSMKDLLKTQSRAKKSQKSEMNSFMDTIQKKANKQNEDRMCYDFIGAINGYTFTILDGHGSKQCADFVHKTINSLIKNRFEQNQKLEISPKKLVEKCLNQAFQDVQKEWFKLYKQHQWEYEFKRSGACCLTAVVLENSIHIANAGDCEGAILGGHQPIKTNKRLNAGEPEQKQRLKRMFPTERNIVVDRQKKTKKCSYVKGLLQPTKAIGDFQLKNAEDNLTIKDFNGPYIDYKPSFTHFRIKPDSKYLVMATDGMWDELSLQTVDQIARENDGSLAKALYSASMKHIKKRNKMTEEELENTQLRRLYHDDISIIAVDLKQLQECLKAHKE